MTYSWRVVLDSPWGKVGEVVEIDLPPREYERFKATHSKELERYIDDPPALGRIA